MHKRYFLRFAYNGSAYAGWQVQPNALTVQEVLNEKLSVILREKTDTLGAGRTDTGVHAREMYCHFDTAKTDMDTDKVLYSLNHILPYDIAAYELFEVHPGAHARFDAVSRTYEYLITNKKDPFLIQMATYIYSNLDMERMNEAAKILFKHIDFSCFSKSNTQVFTNNCTITEAFWRREGDLLIFKITANRFLRNMVRAIVGTLLEVGRHKISVEEVDRIIQSRRRSEAGDSVPADGLYLIKIEYDRSKIMMEA